MGAPKPNLLMNFDGNKKDAAWIKLERNSTRFAGEVENAGLPIL